MTRRRWIADEVHGDTAALVGEHASHLARVLRAQVGQEFDIAAGGEVRRGTITTVSSDRVEFALAGEENPPRGSVRIIVPQVTIALAVFKFDRMEWAIEKCTEIGVVRIIPVIVRRSDTHLATAAAKRQERWQRIARQAAEQSRREHEPEIAAPVKLKDLAAILPAGAARVVLDGSEQGSPLRQVLRSRPAEVVLAVGPEGGWADTELDWFHDNGWEPATLGRTVLRAETAAIVAAALALEALR